MKCFRGLKNLKYKMNGATNMYLVQIQRRVSNEVIESLTTEPVSERQAERIQSRSELNINHREYKVVIVPVDNRTESVDMEEVKVCPVCKKNVLRKKGMNALSRKDNKTEICSDCGTIEAIEAMNNSF